MRTLFFKIVLLLFIFPTLILSGQTKKDSLNYSISINYLIDLSDTYGGGEMFTGEFSVSKSWYGLNFGYGHFLSQSDFIFMIPIEEAGLNLEIPFEEMAIMKMGTLSITIMPVKNKWFSTELIVGTAYAQAKWSCFKGVEYTYDTNEQKFTSLSKDYQLINKTHFGYQVGTNLSFYLTKFLNLQLQIKMQDLSNGGTFFFLGGGLSFKILN